MLTALDARKSPWLTLIIIAALALAAFHYWQFLENPRVRWNGIVHDRGTHYRFAQTLAIALREADPITFFATLDKAKVWPPFHGLCAAIVLAVGGIDYRLAVLPSLAGWVITAVFSFLLARRISGSSGNSAGMIAATMVLASPAHRIYALDIMLESLGAALSVMALYLYTVAKQEPSPRAWRCLALTLTALFLEKYNYWMLVMLALGAAELAGWRAADWQRALALLSRDWWNIIRRELRAPLTWLCCALAGLAMAIFILEPAPLQIGGQPVSLYPPNNLITLAYAALFFRLLMSRPLTHISAPALRQLTLWHALPIAIWFLLPRRLSAFAWFVGPFNVGERSPSSTVEAAAYYAGTIAADYHSATWSAVAAAALFALAVLAFQRLRPGGLAVVLFVIISASVALGHPNQKSRFLHTWLPAAWVAGAAGFVNCLSGIRRLGGPLAVAGAATAVASHAWFLLEPGHAPETGCRHETTSLLDLTDTYLPALTAQTRVALFSTSENADLLEWTYHDRHPHSHALEIPLKHPPRSSEELRRRLGAWQAQTAADTVVLIDIAPESPHYLPSAEQPAHRQVAQLMNSDARFALGKEWRRPELGCTISMWTRR